jgi:hypothetical protein
VPKGMWLQIENDDRWRETLWNTDLNPRAEHCGRFKLSKLMLEWQIHTSLP